MLKDFDSDSAPGSLRSRHSSEPAIAIGEWFHSYLFITQEREIIDMCTRFFFA